MSTIEKCVPRDVKNDFAGAIPELIAWMVSIPDYRDKGGRYLIACPVLESTEPGTRLINKVGPQPLSGDDVNGW